MVRSLTLRKSMYKWIDCFHIFWVIVRRDVIDGKHVGGTDDPFEFQLGREKVIRGWDIGVVTMNVGEIARFIIKPEYAYGSKGFAPKVEPDETLDFEIELLRFKVDERNKIWVQSNDVMLNVM